MIRIFHVIAALFAIAITSASANAAVLVFGEIVEYTGPGLYSAQLFALAVDQPEEIDGYIIEISTTDANITFLNLVYNQVFETVVPAVTGSDPVQLQGMNTAFDGLALAEGQVGTLATLEFLVDGPGVAPISVPGGTVSNQISASIGVPISFISSTQVPEPSSLGLCLFGLAGTFARRRQRI